MSIKPSTFPTSWGKMSENLLVVILSFIICEQLAPGVLCALSSMEGECCKFPGNTNTPANTTVTSICPNCSKWRTFLSPGTVSAEGGGGGRGVKLMYLITLLASILSCTALYRSYHHPAYLERGMINNDWIRWEKIERNFFWEEQPVYFYSQ